MEIKIYRDGQYDYKANLMLKAKNFMRKEAKVIDYIFENHSLPARATDSREE